LKALSRLAIYSVDLLTDWPRRLMPSFRMDARPEPRIVSCDRMDGGIVVSFDDGKTALYSAVLLHATLPQARAMPLDSGADWHPHGA
jgi:hypothetical protein